MIWKTIHGKKVPSQEESFGFSKEDRGFFHVMNVQVIKCTKSNKQL